MNKKQFGKKGIFLTFIAISLIAAFILVFTPSDLSLQKDISAAKTRVTTINEYVVDLENVYLEEALQSSGTKTILALTEYMQVQDKFLPDFEDSFREVLLYGTIGGQPIDSFIEPDIMAGNTYPDWLEKIRATADNAFNVHTAFGGIAVNDVQVYQTRPWLLAVDANISFNVSSETASWDKNILVRSEIDIQNFNDPYYLINTAGSYVNRINQSEVSFSQWDINNVKDHVRYGTYVHFENSRAPNFIMRFTNTSLNSSCCGIESLVNPNNPAIGNPMESYADYLFFNHSYQNKCTELYNITEPSFQGEFPGFALDFEHLVLYNLAFAEYAEPCSGGALPEEPAAPAASYDFTISSNTFNYNLYEEAGFPSQPVDMTLTIGAGVMVGSTITSQPALTTGNLPAGSTVTIINNGRIQGRGGDGGKGYATTFEQYVGKNGGDAIEIKAATTIDNTNGKIWSGGGGGSGNGPQTCSSGGGGGGAGYIPGTHGTSYDGGCLISEAQDGTTEHGGAGATSTSTSGAGNPGGNPGQNGGGSPGGAAGYSVKTNGNTLVWIAQGNLKGAIS